MINVGPELMSKHISELTVSEFCALFEACLSYYTMNKNFVPDELPLTVSVKELIRNVQFDSYAAKRTTTFWLAKYAIEFQDYLNQPKPPLSNGLSGLLKTKIDLANISKEKLDSLHCKQCAKDKIRDIVISQGYQLLD